MTQNAVIYRGATCPHGMKAKSLLARKGYAVTDNILQNRAEIDAFKARENVATAPQIWIGDDRIGGYTDLKAHLGYRVLGKGDTSYRPILAIFGSTALMATALMWNFYASFDPGIWLRWFFALSMVVLAVQKLQDVEGFVSGFLGYDLLARRYVPYGYAYPFLELYAGVGMMALIGTGAAAVWLVAPVSLVIGGIGAISVIKAVYIDKRALTCACVGGGSNVPLGAVSLTENLVMVAMGLWMLLG